MNPARMDDAWTKMAALTFRVLVFLLLACSSALARDFIIVKKMHFTLKTEGANYRLGASMKVEQTFVSGRSAFDRKVEITENAHTIISNLRAEHRGKPLDPRWIQSRFPRSEDLFIEPGRIHEITLPPDLKAGDSIIYSYDQSFDEPAFFPLIRVPVLDSISRFEVIIDHPQELEVDFSVFYGHGSLDPRIQRGTPTRTSLVFEGLPGPLSLPADPYEWLHAAILTKITRAGQPLNPYTPETFTRWYLAKLEAGSGISERMRTLLAEEIRKSRTRRETARILFDYVKSNIRYIADEGSGHAFLPHPSAEVLDRKWGDCKDKARLLTVLARLHGIPMHMALVNTRPSPAFEDVNLFLFNHVICVMEDGGELVFMDPTDPYSELGDPPESDLLARALILDAERPRYVVIPRQQETPDVDLRLTADLEHLEQGKARMILRHSWKSRTLRAWKELDDKSFARYMQQRFEQILPKLPLEDFRPREEDRERLIVEATADLSEYFVASDQRVYVPSAPFRSINREYLERDKDAHAIETTGPAHLRLEATLSGVRPSPTAPQKIKLGTTGEAYYSAELSTSAGKAKVVATFDLPFRVIPPNARKSFLEFCSGYLKANQQLFQLQRNLR